MIFEARKTKKEKQKSKAKGRSEQCDIPSLRGGLHQSAQVPESMSMTRLLQGSRYRPKPSRLISGVRQGHRDERMVAMLLAT